MLKYLNFIEKNAYPKLTIEQYPLVCVCVIFILCSAIVKTHKRRDTCNTYTRIHIVVNGVASIP